MVDEDETNGEWEKELEDMLGEAPTESNNDNNKSVEPKTDQKKD